MFLWGSFGYAVTIKSMTVLSGEIELNPGQIIPNHRNTWDTPSDNYPTCPVPLSDTNRAPT